MAKTKEINQVSRSTILIVTAIVVAVSIGLAAVTHADDRGERGERSEREGRGGFLNFFSKFDLRANMLSHDLRVRINEEDIRVQGAIVSATSTSGFTATTNDPAFTFNVQTDASTKFQIKGAGNGSMTDIAVGDTVNFRGLILSGTTTSTLTVQASHVEDKTKLTVDNDDPNRNRALKFIARLEAFIAQLKLRLGL